jgi:hypothetical protein
LCVLDVLLLPLSTIFILGYIFIYVLIFHLYECIPRLLIYMSVYQGYSFIWVYTKVTHLYECIPRLLIYMTVYQGYCANFYYKTYIQLNRERFLLNDSCTILLSILWQKQFTCCFDDDGGEHKINMPSLIFIGAVVVVIVW